MISLFALGDVLPLLFFLSEGHKVKSTDGAFGIILTCPVELRWRRATIHAKGQDGKSRPWPRWLGAAAAAAMAKRKRMGWCADRSRRARLTGERQCEKTGTGRGLGIEQVAQSRGENRRSGGSGDEVILDGIVSGSGARPALEPSRGLWTRAQARLPDHGARKRVSPIHPAAGGSRMRWDGLKIDILCSKEMAHGLSQQQPGVQTAGRRQRGKKKSSRKRRKRPPGIRDNLHRDGPLRWCLWEAVA